MLLYSIYVTSMWYPVWSSHHHPTTAEVVLETGAEVRWQLFGHHLQGPTNIQQLRVFKTPTPSMPSWNDLPWKMVISMDSWWDIWWSIESGYRIWDDIWWKRDLSMMKFTNLTSATLFWADWSLHGTLPHVATFPASSTEWIRETHCFSPIIPLCWTARAANWWWPIYLFTYLFMYLILTTSHNTHLTYLSTINHRLVIATGFRVDQVDRVELWVRTVRRMRSDCRANWSK